MKFNFFKALYLILVSSTALYCGKSFAKDSLALESKEVDFFNQQANRPTKLKFWYQASGQPCAATVCLSESQKTHRVAIISHGAFGSPREMNWLGYALASQGWVVAGVAHFGESWVYGVENIDPSSAMRFWQRPQDVSFAIDKLTDTGLFNTPLNVNNVIMLGHSSGGFTSLAMAGASLDGNKSRVYCASEKAKVDKGCSYGKQSKAPAMSDKMLAKIGLLQTQMKDERIAAVIALDPALGHTVSADSLSEINIPTLVVGSVDNDFLPYETHAKYYAEHTKGADLVGIEQGAGHFVYIDKCDSQRQVNGVFLCKDRQGVDRAEIQRKVLGHVFGFIFKNGLG